MYGYCVTDNWLKRYSAIHCYPYSISEDSEVVLLTSLPAQLTEGKAFPMWNNCTKVPRSYALASIITTDDDQHVSQILDRDDNTRSCGVSIIGFCTNDNYKYAIDHDTGYSIRTIHPVPQAWLWDPMSKVVKKNAFELVDDPRVRAQKPLCSCTHQPS